MKAIGICLGASSISLVVIEKESFENSTASIQLLKSDSRSHEGDILNVMQSMLSEIAVDGAIKIAVTGRKLRKQVNLPSIAEAEAVELAYSHLKEKYPGCDGIVSAGGENFMAYQLSPTGRLINVYTGNKCASGTGEFFLQQINRMNLSTDEALNTALVDSPYSVAGRCSVFCKSDCTHALNKGVAKGKVIAGLCKMMALKILELLNKCPANKLLFIGGAAKNQVMIDYIKSEIEGTHSIQVADEALYFEAMGAALWALNNESTTFNDLSNLICPSQNSNSENTFTFLPAIQDFSEKVIFKSIAKDTAQAGDSCIVGLDVGSTTTKAVIIREKDNAILASVYLRTNGDPIKAARECYRSLATNTVSSINVKGIGITGSGRQIAGLHANTEGVINEIIAHATAAVFFDPEVDTIFEIGGQDAKYTYITNKVPSDYAMNEACSAGTGSFLEEAAQESMGISTLEIADIALNSNNPPNFNDQCAAFIGSDIKTAIQEGINRDDIVGGLVYSICQNYVNRVKGNRMIGKKIFMQGGVCYNRAVPIAMAALIGKEIIVPPEPGLMGAFGVALEVKNKLELGLIAPKQFQLAELADRQVAYGNPFICHGGKEKGDRKCNINMIDIEQVKYPFGGACNKYVNIRKKIKYNEENLDLITLRERLIFEKYAQKTGRNPGAKRIGIAKSLLVNTLYPLYFNFFSELGLDVILGHSVDSSGIEQKGASFCYPVELSHGFMADLLKKNTDYIFMPNIQGMYVKNGIDTSVTCPLVQGEPYYLRSAFKELSERKIISPILDFSKGYHWMSEKFIQIGRDLGFSRKATIKAFQFALAQQEAFLQEAKAIGQKVISDLEADPNRTAIVLFGRPYNAFTQDANMGIPVKFATRGQFIIPWEFLAFEQEASVRRMFWSLGQMMLKAANVVKKHPQLFGTYITNFSCGPDSFLLNFFRDIMGQKPSLTLELDSHTADAGIDTRIEAFLDVVTGYLELQKYSTDQRVIPLQRMATSSSELGGFHVIDSHGEKYNLRDKRIQVMVPSMGAVGSRLLAASLRHMGISASAMSAPTEKELNIGRANSSCKECLPFTLVAGSILNDIPKHDKNKLLVYFMADSSGPCRFGQYIVLMEKLLQKNNLQNATVMSLSSDNGYASLGSSFQLRAWQSLVIAEVMEDIYGALLVLAQDKESALAVYEQSVRTLEEAVATKSWHGIQHALAEEARKLAAIPKKGPLDSAVRIGMVGEIYVRLDSFARQYLVEKLAEKQIIVKVAPVTEFVYFCDYLLQKAIYHVKPSTTDKISSVIKGFFKQHYERKIKKIMEQSGLYKTHMLDIPSMVNKVKHLIAPEFTAGDTVLTVGAALTDIIDHVSGIISIGPFGCMPCRVSEAILGDAINSEKLKTTSDTTIIKKVMEHHPALPFLSIESDGNPFPQIIEAKLEIFCMQVIRVHNLIMSAKQYNQSTY